MPNAMTRKNVIRVSMISTTRTIQATMMMLVITILTTRISSQDGCHEVKQLAALARSATPLLLHPRAPSVRQIAPRPPSPLHLVTPWVYVFFPPLLVCVPLSHPSISRFAQALQPIAIFGVHSMHRLLGVKVTLPFQAFALFSPVHVNWCLSLPPLTFCTGTTFFSNVGLKNCRALS